MDECAQATHRKTKNNFWTLERIVGACHCQLGDSIVMRKMRIISDYKRDQWYQERRSTRD